MALYSYVWEESIKLSQHAPNCRSKDCQKAHYRDGEPKRKMIALVVKPNRGKYFNWIWFCPNCKRIRLMANNDFKV